jgi:hypothetical protein
MATAVHYGKAPKSVHGKDGQSVILYRQFTTSLATLDREDVFLLPPGTTVLSVSGKVLTASGGGATVHSLDCVIEQMPTPTSVWSPLLNGLVQDNFTEFTGAAAALTGVNQTDAEGAIYVNNLIVGGPQTSGAVVEIIAEVIRTNYTAGVGP